MIFKAGDAIQVLPSGSPSGKLEYGEIVSGPHNGTTGFFYQVNFDDPVFGSLSIWHISDEHIESISPLPSGFSSLAPGTTIYYESINQRAQRIRPPEVTNAYDYFEEEKERQERYKKEGRCLKCGVLMYFDKSLYLICPTHGPETQE